mmetsp:Transcript_18310/g.57592  ORF Transcript_18310/g.57592 Transcript_18310/m.57592 type:complete len:262 (+) Transcript_18310:2425-3210(+)
MNSRNSITTHTTPSAMNALFHHRRPSRWPAPRIAAAAGRDSLDERSPLSRRSSHGVVACPIVGTHHDTMPPRRGPAMVLLALAARPTAGLLATTSPSRVARPGARCLADDELAAFWLEMNTDEEEVVVAAPPPRRPARAHLEPGARDDDFRTVQFAPRIFQCSPGGDDFVVGEPSRTETAPRGSRSEPAPRLTSQTSHYATLGVSPDASFATIRAAYAALAKQCHPDRGGDRRDFEAVSRAWAALADPARRAKYDKSPDRP